MLRVGPHCVQLIQLVIQQLQEVHLQSGRVHVKLGFHKAPSKHLSLSPHARDPYLHSCAREAIHQHTALRRLAGLRQQRLQQDIPYLRQEAST